MLKKNSREDILFRLLRIALGGKPEPIPADVNWQGVMDLAARQGVLAICFETLEKLPAESRPDMDTLMDWLGQTSFIESQYENHLALAKELCAKWAKAGVPTMVFKGLAHSRYYPNPAHREFGDFDCYQFGRIAEGNKVAAKMDANVDDDWYKHSKIQYKELSVENHRFFTAVRSNRDAKALNDYMVNTLGDGAYLTKLEGTEILLPPLELEGMFMLHHSLRHFLEEGITVRHFCDWACWIKANRNKIVWDSFYGQCKRFRLDGFADVMNEIAGRYLNVDLDLNLNVDQKLRVLADKVVENALYEDTSIHNKGKGVWYERVHLFTNAFRHSWKYKEVGHYSTMGYLMDYVRGFIFRNDED